MILRSYYFFLFLETRLCIAAVTEDPLTRNEATVREELQANGSIGRNERRKQRNKKKTKSKTIQYTACEGQSTYNKGCNGAVVIMSSLVLIIPLTGLTTFTCT